MASRTRLPSKGAKPKLRSCEPFPSPWSCLWRSLGCQAQACSDVGAPPHDRASTWVESSPTSTVRYARGLCVEDTCDSTEKSNGQRLAFLYLDEPSIDDEGPVIVELVIESGSGETFFRREPGGRTHPEAAERS